MNSRHSETFTDKLTVKLAEAHEALSNATKVSNDHAEATRKQAEAFNEQQADIDRRLKELTGSDSSDEAAKRFEASIEKLRRLEISRDYMTLLKEAEDLRYGVVIYPGKDNGR